MEQTVQHSSHWQRLYATLPLLHPHDIRVIDIERSEDYKQGLRARMRVIRLAIWSEGDHEGRPILTDCPKYQTLSYAWGDSIADENMTLNSHPVSITAHLCCALKRVREKISRDGETPRPPRVFSQTLWVDAICINQHDDDEKSKQVQLMGSIYEASSRLVVWLGEEPEEHSGWDLLNALLGQGTTDQAVTALELMLGTCAWFRRRWVIQELMRSRRHSRHILYGRTRFSFDLLISGTNNITKRAAEADIDIRLSVAKASLLQVLMNGTTNYHTMKLPTLREDWEYLLENLILHINSECREPLDRAYSLIGFSRDPVVVDYGQSFRELYIQIAQSYLLRTPYYNKTPPTTLVQLVLLLASATSVSLDSVRGPLPSWTPNWNQTLSTDSPQHKYIVDECLYLVRHGLREGVETDSIHFEGDQMLLKGYLIWPCTHDEDRSDTCVNCWLVQRKWPCDGRPIAGHTYRPTLLEGEALLLCHGWIMGMVLRRVADNTVGLPSFCLRSCFYIHDRRALSILSNPELMTMWKLFYGEIQPQTVVRIV